MHRSFTILLLVLFSSFLAAQTTPKSSETKDALHSSSDNTAVDATIKQIPVKTVEGPKGEVLTPKEISLGDSTIPGDSEVVSVLGDLNLLSARYQDELKELQNKLNAKYGPEWDKDQEKIQKAIQKVKDANKWGDDVVYSASSKQWIKLTPDEVKAMKKATAASNVSAPAAKK